MRIKHMFGVMPAQRARQIALEARRDEQQLLLSDIERVIRQTSHGGQLQAKYIIDVESLPHYVALDVVKQLREVGYTVVLDANDAGERVLSILW